MPLQIVRNDITKMQVDAIVNPANPKPVFGAGIDTAVYTAAGADALLAKRREIGDIAAGSSVLTDGFNLPAKYIIHTVGTAWQGGEAGEEEVIRNCYKSVFRVAEEHGVQSLAIPLLASGSYGFPKGIALRIALSEIEAHLADHDTELYLVVFDRKSVHLSSELYGDIDAYINDNYVEEKRKEEYDYGPVPNGRMPQDGRMPRDAGPYYDMSRANMAGATFTGAAVRMEELSADMDESAGRSEEKHKESRFGLGRKKLREVVEADACAAPVMESLRAERLEKKRSLEDVIENLDKTFMEMVFSFADDKGLTDVEVQKRANLDRKAFSKLKCGTTRNPSKSTALALAVALQLNLDETKDLLSRAGFAFSPCSRQDLIVQYFIEREAYDIHEINIALFEHGEESLGVHTH
ncbi:MAG: macro domain-containing protein [Lachnospiraceae bacterium]|nr:macro domain-containing protein [Lachnospiraceae bacterium]